MTPFERLTAWKVSHEMVLHVYRVTSNWPPHERFGLTSQLRRAAASIPTNIAEGSAKRGAREFRRFLDIAIGSLGEVTYLMILAKDLGYLTTEKFSVLEEVRSRAGRLTWRLYQAIDRRAKR